MSYRASDKELVSVVIDFLKYMWFTFAQMATLLGRFSMKVNGQLRFHASLASNRLSLLAKNLEDGLTYLGADFLNVSSLEELRDKCGVYTADALTQLAESLSALENRSRSEAKLGVKAELEKFEGVLKTAVNAFSKMEQAISEQENSKAKLLSMLLKDVVDDLKIIWERIQEAKTLLSDI